MQRLIQSTSLLLVCVTVAAIRAQPSTPLAPDQPSNGMLELRVKQAFDPEPPLRQNELPREPVWRGLIEVTLKNISRGTVHIEDGGITYQFSVLDSAGRPVPLTEYGKKVEASKQGPQAFSGPVSIFDLAPGRELTEQVHLSVVYQIEPGQGYTVAVRRSRGFPMVDHDGWPVMPPRRELRVTLPIPAKRLIER